MENKKKIAEAILKEDVFSQFLGFEIIEADDEILVARIPFRENVINTMGATHGGALYALADITAGTLACMCGYFCTTVNGNLNYLEPAVAKEYISCTAKIVRRGFHVTVVNVEITSDTGKLLDTGSFNFFRSELAITGSKEQ